MPKSSSSISTPAARHMAHHRSRTRRRRLAPVRLLSYPRMGVGLPDALRAGISSSAVRTYHERDIYTARKYVRDFYRRMNDAKASEFYCPLPITESLHKKDYKYGNIRRKSRTAEERVGRSSKRRPTSKFVPRIRTYLASLRIIREEVFTLDDINKCRQEIMRQHPGYERPITADSGILLAAEAIRKSFGRKYYLPLYKYPILIDFGTPDGRYA